MASPYFWRGAIWISKRIFAPTPGSVLPFVEALVDAAAPGLRWMRDPTRGGVATSLNELARDCGLGIVLHEDWIPVRDAVRGACELLGLDPLHIANEGQFLAVVAPEFAELALDALQRTPGGRRSGHHRRSARNSPLPRCSASHPMAERASSTCWWAIRCRAFVRLMMPTQSTLATADRRTRCWRAIAIFEDFFAQEAPRLAAVLREMAERFLRGGRLLAFGRGPCATDAQHVSVEFVHPGDRRQARVAGAGSFR